MRELERRFPPEFRNRIDEVVVFSPLTKDEVRHIACLYLDRVAETLRRKNRTLTVDADALEHLVEKGHSLAYGARFLKRVVDEHVKLPISQRWNEAHTFSVRLRDGAIVIETAGPHLVSQLAYGA